MIYYVAGKNIEKKLFPLEYFFKYNKNIFYIIFDIFYLHSYVSTLT